MKPNMPTQSLTPADDEEYRCMTALENAVARALCAAQLSSLAASWASDCNTSDDVALYAAEQAAEAAKAVEKAFYYLPGYRPEGAAQ